MSNLNDCRLSALQTITGNTGHWQDLFYEALSGTGAETLNELIFTWLGTQGATQDNLNDRWVDFLLSSGYSGSLSDMKKEWWCDGGNGLPTGVPFADTTAITADTTAYTADTY